jgi:hypothetical protein
VTAVTCRRAWLRAVTHAVLRASTDPNLSRKRARERGNLDRAGLAGHQNTRTRADLDRSRRRFGYRDSISWLLWPWPGSHGPTGPTSTPGCRAPWRPWRPCTGVDHQLHGLVFVVRSEPPTCASHNEQSSLTRCPRNGVKATTVGEPRSDRARVVKHDRGPTGCGSADLRRDLKGTRYVGTAFSESDTRSRSMSTSKTITVIVSPTLTTSDG